MMYVYEFLNMIIQCVISRLFGVLRRVCVSMCIYTCDSNKRPYMPIWRQIWRVRYLYTIRPCLYHGLFAMPCYAIDRRRRPAFQLAMVGVSSPKKRTINYFVLI